MDEHLDEQISLRIAINKNQSLLLARLIVSNVGYQIVG